MLFVLDTNNGLLGLSILSICPTRRRANLSSSWLSTFS